MWDFTRRDITFPSDRLPALAGIAKELGRVLDYTTYRYGIWMEDPIGLLWSHDKTYRHSSYEQDGRVLIAQQAPDSPSWSWASWNQPVLWLMPGYALTLPYHFKVSTPEGGLVRLFPQSDTGYPYAIDISGPLVLVPPENFAYSENHHYQWIGTQNLEDVDFTAMTDGWHRGNGAADPPWHFMPMVKVRSPYSYYKPYYTWGSLLKLHPEAGRAVYIRVGIGAFACREDNMEERFPLYQKALKDNEYIDMDEHGICNITII